jgi:hypothetical protein
MAFLTALMLGMAPAPSAEWVTRIYNGWRVSAVQPSSCSAIKEFEGGIVIYVEYDERRDEVTFALRDPSFKSLKEGDTYSLATDLELKDGQIANFGQVNFRGRVDGDIAAIVAAFDGKEFLGFLEQAARVRIKRGGINVADVDVSYGQGWQISALRDCAALMAKKNPSDPFAD